MHFDVARKPEWTPRACAWAAFVAVEAGAELARRRMTGLGAGPLSSAEGALLATAIWTYLAHGRYAFRGAAQAGLATLPPFVALSLAVAVGRSLFDRLCGGADGLAVFAAAVALKYALVRTFIWPRLDSGSGPARGGPF